MIQKLKKSRENIENLIGFGITIAKVGISDPRKFAQNFLLKAERILGFQDNIGLRKSLTNGLSPIEIIERRGDFGAETDKALSIESRGWLRWLDYLALKRIQRMKRQFRLSIVESVKRESPPRYENVLIYLTNSLPYTQSGYSLRSQNLYSALGSQNNVNVTAITRYGYPWVIGRALPDSFDTVENIRYFRVLPLFFSLDPERALKGAVDFVVKFCRENEVTIIHTTTDFSNALVVSRAASELGIPWVYEVRGEPESTWLATAGLDSSEKSDLPSYFSMFRGKEDEAIRAAWRVITLSDTSSKKLRERGHSDAKLRVIPNGFRQSLLEDSPNPRNLRQERQISSETILIGVISSIVRYEGIDTLIRATPLLPANYQVVIVGAGEHLNDLKKLAEELKVDERILFVGAVPEYEAMSWYHEIDIFCVPRIDSEVTRSVTPLKSLPASALKVPIVASDLPALREVTGGYACFFEPENHEELARALTSFQDSTYDLEAGRTWAESRTWNALGANLATIYDGA